MPVLFIAATRDRLVKPRTVRALLELRPGLRIEWLDRPHLVLQTRAEAAARAIARFLLPSIDESARSRD